MSTPEIETLKAALIGRLSSLVHTLYGDHAKWTGHEWRIGDVRGEPGSSLAIEGRDPARLGLWHDHNPAADMRGGDVLDLIAGAQATDFKGAVAWAKAFLGNADLPPAPMRSTTLVPAINADVRSKLSTDLRDRSGELLKPAHPRSLTQASNALFKHKGAMAQLRKRGLTPKTIKHFHLGLYSYEGKQSQVKDALSAPVLDANGVPLKRSLFSRLPRVTEGGPDAKDWAAGKPGTYWVTPAEGRTELFVCEGAKDGWWLWQALRGSPLLQRLCIITSTHGSGIPAAWHSPEFWQDWNKVYLAQDADEAGEALAQRVRALAGRDVYRVRVPEDYGKDWTGFFLGGQTVDDLATLLGTALVFGIPVEPGPPIVPHQEGTHAVIPVDVSRAYVNGHLYIPFRVLESQTEQVRKPNGEATTRTIQRYRTLVLRSDGVVCSFSYLPAPRGTPKHDRVLALSDGTLLSRPPVVGEATTFSPVAITRFREARASGQSAMTPTPTELLERIHNHMRGSVVLSRPEDYALLTFVVVASYAQAIFDAVPLVQLTGPGGNAAGKALLELGCNAALVNGRTPVTTAFRSLDRLGGLAIIDLGGMAKHNSEEELKAFVRQLKASTRKDTSQSNWTNPETLQVELLNFYGIKVLLSPTRADKRLSIPLLWVYARMPIKDASALPHATTELQELRNALHTWVLENVSQINRRYRQLYAKPQSPQEALRAPLSALAELLGHYVLSNQLQAALALQETPVPEPLSSVQRVHQAVRNLIRQGYRHKVTLKQLMLELQLLARDDQEDDPTTKHEWREPRWVGRTLRAEKLINPNAKGERLWLMGEQTRVVVLEPGFVTATLNDFEAQGVVYASTVRQPLDFCYNQPCEACFYQDDCTMRARKEKGHGDP